ncbi:MAG TPA: nitroreductase family protein, partial [Nannocystaceae bacterium]|nr:nitroreductase family protein [Nannocystaceae bacterium]
QDWCYLVVESREQKAALAKLHRSLYRLYNPIVERMAKGDERELRQIRPGQWQTEHFEELPVFVIPCYRRNQKHKPVGRPQISVASFYGSVYPAVQNLLLGCRAVGLGASALMLYLPVCTSVPSRIAARSESCRLTSARPENS